METADKEKENKGGGDCEINDNIKTGNEKDEKEKDNSGRR